MPGRDLILAPLGGSGSGGWGGFGPDTPPPPSQQLDGVGAGGVGPGRHPLRADATAPGLHRSGGGGGVRLHLSWQWVSLGPSWQSHGVEEGALPNRSSARLGPPF